MSLLTVVALLKAKPGKEGELRQALLDLVDPSRGESGCVQYDLHISTDKPGEFLFFEKWVDRAALNAHGQRPHMQALGSRREELLAEAPDIRTYSRLT
jgi:quinol monooxygenase YgiN